MPAKYILSKYSYTLDLLLITLTNNPSNFHISHNYILPHSLRFIAQFQYLIPTKRKEKKRKENKAYGCRYRGGGGGAGMKFGKRLKQQVEETLPEWRDKFLSYKDLKKVVKLVSCVSPSMLMGGSLDLQQQGSKGEAEFVYLLNDEIEKFNAFFMEQEEDFIIRHKELQQRIQKAVVKWGPWGSQLSDTAYLQEIRMIRKDIVDFHGEMVLLINYSNINYTGLAKILKKYDKRTGGLLRLAFIQKVSQQPFFTTELISKLIKECESTIDTLFPVSQQSIKQGENAAAITVVGEGIFRNTVAALLTMKEIRRSSSTYGHHSLPPLNLPDSDIIHSLHAKPPIPIP